MNELLSLLANPLMQLLLIAGAVVGLSWVSKRDEARRVAQGLAPRSWKAILLEGIGLSQPRPVRITEAEDIWVVAARELGLPVEKVLQLKQRVQPKEAAPKHSRRKQQGKGQRKLTPTQQVQQLPDGVVPSQVGRETRGEEQAE